MSGISSIGGAMSVDRVMQLRAEILARNEALSRAGATGPTEAAAAPAKAGATSFADTLETALKQVNDNQSEASRLSASYERGETVDIAKVMLARQEASIGFEATLQVRNKILSAYKDIMSMSV